MIYKFSNVGVETEHPVNDNVTLGNNLVDEIRASFTGLNLVDYIRTIVFQRPDGSTTPELPMRISNDRTQVYYELNNSIVNQVGAYSFTIRLKQASDGTYITRCTAGVVIGFHCVASVIPDTEQTITVDQYNELLDAIEDEASVRAEIGQQLPKKTDYFENNNNTVQDLYDAVGSRAVVVKEGTSIALVRLAAYSDYYRYTSIAIDVSGSADRTAMWSRIGNMNPTNTVAQMISATRQNDYIILNRKDVYDLLNAKVDKTTTINGKALSTNIVLGTSDIQHEGENLDVLLDNIQSIIEERTTRIELLEGITLVADYSNYKIWLEDANGNQLGDIIDLPLESVVVSGEYDSATKKVILTLQNGTTVEFSVADLVSGLVSTSTFNDTVGELRSDILDRSKVSVSNTGTSTSEVSYITINGTEHKLAGGGGSSVEVYDGLDSTDTDKALSANQGKVLNEKIEAIEVPTKTSDLTNDSGFITDSYHDTTKENVSNKSETLDSSTTKYPTNKAVKDVTDAMQQQINSLGQRGRFLSDWNATTGMPVSFPETTPYAYKSGDYYVVATVGATNYKPNGIQYTGAASSTVETLEVKANDTYMFDGSNWILQKNTVDLSGYLQTSHNTDNSAHSILFKHDPYSNVYRIAGSDIAAIYDVDGNAISSTYAKKTEVSDKLDKRTSDNEVYSHSGSTQGGIAYTNSPTANTIAQRDANGRMQTATPTANNDCANKSYVDIQGAFKQPKFVATSLTVTTNQWVLTGGKYVFSTTITGLKTENDVTQVCEISLTGSTASIGAEAKIIPSCTTAGTLVLTASYIPSGSVTFNIVMWN